MMKTFRRAVIAAALGIGVASLLSSAQLCAQPISNEGVSSCYADKLMKREALQRAIDKLANPYADNIISTLILSSGC